MEVWRLLGPRCSGLELRLWGNGDDATRCLPNPETFGSQVGVVIRDELRYGFLASVLRFMQSGRKESPRGKSPAADSNKRVWKASALAAAKSTSTSGILTYGHSELASVLGAASMVANKLLSGFKRERSGFNKDTRKYHDGCEGRR